MKIVLVGYFGFSNLGDDLLAAAAVAAARGQFPNVQMTVLSGNPSLTTSFLGVPAIPMFDIPSVLRALRSCDRLVFGGGGIFQDQTSGRSLAYYLGLLALARIFGKPAGLANMGVDPISNRFLSRFFRWLVSDANVAFSVRDEASRFAAVAAGVSDAKIRVTADGVFAFERDSHPVASVSPRRGVLLVVRVPPPAFTDVVPVRLARLGDRDALAIAVAALQPGADESLARRVAGGKHATVLPLLDVHTAFDAIAGVERVASGRYHALVLAARAGKPFLGFGDHGKIRSLCVQFGMPFLRWDANAAEVEAAFGRLMVAAAPDPGLVNSLRERAREGFLFSLGVTLKESAGL